MEERVGVVRPASALRVEGDGAGGEQRGELVQLACRRQPTATPSGGVDRGRRVAPSCWGLAATATASAAAGTALAPALGWRLAALARRLAALAGRLAPVLACQAQPQVRLSRLWLRPIVKIERPHPPLRLCLVLRLPKPQRIVQLLPRLRELLLLKLLLLPKPLPEQLGGAAPPPATAAAAAAAALALATAAAAATTTTTPPCPCCRRGPCPWRRRPSRSLALAATAAPAAPPPPPTEARYGSKKSRLATVSYT